jgi:hypothetical protein
MYSFSFILFCWLKICMFLEQWYLVKQKMSSRKDDFFFNSVYVAFILVNTLDPSLLYLKHNMTVCLWELQLSKSVVGMNNVVSSMI